MREATQMWEAGQRSMAEGWRQAQEFWNTAARNWGDIASAWMGGMSSTAPGMAGETTAVWRELQDAAFAVGSAWMRLPFVLATFAPPLELQEAVMRLTQAQGRAYQLWIEALTRTATATTRATSEATKAAGAATKAAGKATQEAGEAMGAATTKKPAA
jgi:hypothetical protein